MRTRTRARAGARVLAVAGIAFATMPLTAAASRAAPPSSTDCFTTEESHDFGRGEVTVCPNGDGTYRATGWVEDLLPGDGAFSGPDGGCVTWYLYSATQYENFTTTACPHFGGPAKLQFDNVVTPDNPITRASLGTFWA
jgi:hypothetical protein